MTKSIGGSGMTNKEKCLAVLDDARAFQICPGEWVVAHGNDPANPGYAILGPEFYTEEAAWQNAAESLPAQPEQCKLQGKGPHWLCKCDAYPYLHCRFCSKPVAPLPEKECGNCGHPRHTDDANWQCKECLNENTLGVRPIDQVCAAYCPTTDDDYVRSVFPDAWEAPYSHWIWTREPKESDSVTDRPICLSTGGWRVAAQYIRTNPVPPCPGDPKGTRFCEFHECENDWQTAKPQPDSSSISTGHKFGMADEELDEVFVNDAFVHVERMDDTAFWIGIDSPNLPTIHIRTGVYRGIWYFNLEEDTLEGGRYLQINRPRKNKVPIPRGRATPETKTYSALHREIIEKGRKVLNSTCDEGMSNTDFIEWVLERLEGK